MRLSPVDIIFAIILVLAMWRGYSRGLLRTAATYVAPVLAFMLAKDFSDPVRDRLALYQVVPEFALEFFAPLIVFIVVVVVVRLFASLVARLLGVGLSLPSRVLAGLASVAIIAVVLGGVVILVHELRPPERVKLDTPGEAPGDPFESLLATLNQRFSESLLAAPLEQLASRVLTETMGSTQHSSPVGRDIRDQIEGAAQKAAGAAIDSLGKPPAARRDSPLSASPASSGSSAASKEEPARPAGTAARTIPQVQPVSPAAAPDSRR